MWEDVIMGRNEERGKRMSKKSKKSKKSSKKKKKVESTTTLQSTSLQGTKRQGRDRYLRGGSQPQERKALKQAHLTPVTFVTLSKMIIW